MFTTRRTPANRAASATLMVPWILTLKAPITLLGHAAGDDGRRVQHRIDVMGLDDSGESRQVQHVPLKGYVVRGPELALQKSIPRLEIEENETFASRRGKRPEGSADKPTACNQSRHAEQSNMDGGGLGEGRAWRGSCLLARCSKILDPREGNRCQGCESAAVTKRGISGGETVMNWASSEIVGVLSFLLPGFVAAAIFYSLTSYPQTEPLRPRGPSSDLHRDWEGHHGRSPLRWEHRGR